MAVKVKICGLTREADVLDALDAGADALGFVFAASPRQLDGQAARRLTSQVPGGIIRVGLFMDQTAAEIQAILDHVELDLLQFHGSETENDCGGFGLPYIKAISMQAANPQQASERYPGASGLLLDSHAEGGAGGTGHRFDWSRRIESDLPLWLAGGLTPDNVAAAVEQFRPWAVDVSSGVEDAPGIKNPDKMRQFVQNAKQD